MIPAMPDRVQAQDALLARFAIDGHDCYVVPEDESDSADGVRIVGSVTLGKRRYSICLDQPDTHSAPTDLLTARELQIAVLIAQGFDKKGIGRRLGISSFTVSTHLARTYFKLGVNSRPALAARIAGTVALHRRPADPTRTVDEALPSV